ncbi:unnamed protein product [Thlaspi arvense]|uniref:Uncharacterized protein n=1 Tax=Thlaspi arvense TaxID=13288 RepID=A0AAU9RKZ2_THLAR|nr:unnamed protein product [Thlaspi arvense]
MRGRRESSNCRLRGKIDSNGCTAAFLEERLNMGLNFILSAEVRIFLFVDKGATFLEILIVADRSREEGLQIWGWVDGGRIKENLLCCLQFI